MSVYNTNFAPLTTNANLLNGMQTAASDAATPQTQQYYQQKHQPPSSQHQPVPQQLQQQQQHQNLPQQQQQQIPQNVQQMGSVLPPPPQFNNTFVNKYLPPTSIVVSTTMATSTPTPTPPLTTTSHNINGAPSGISGTNPISNLPPHMRSVATPNGPLSLNGSSYDGTSATSSRTSSPALQNMCMQLPSNAVQSNLAITTDSQSSAATLTTSHYKQTTVLQRITAGGNSNLSINSANGPHTIVAPQHQPTTTPTTETIQRLKSNAVNLTNSMQNLNLNSGTAVTRLAGSGHVNDMKISTNSIPLNASNSSVVTRMSDISGPSPSNEFRGQVIAPVSDTLFRPIVPASKNPANMFGSAMSPVMAALSSNPNVTTSVDSRGTTQMSQGNNNTPLVTEIKPQLQSQNININALSMTTQQVSNVPSQRKPMYPVNAQLPGQSVNQQLGSQQQSNPYAPAYQTQVLSQYQQQHQQQQVPPPRGMFNGQPNSGALRYQTQSPQSQTPSQQAVWPTTNPPYSAQYSVTNQGFSRLWGQDTIDLMQNRHILSPATLSPPKIVLHNQFHESINCSPSIMRCTVTKIPENNSLLQKSRLPLGILIHPFRDINSLPVIQCPNIVRCRLCRTYINPFVYFVDSKMWKCNLCYRVNELPEDFQFDPATKTFGDVTRRPEVRSSTIEFIAPSEYMLRPPQPAIYLFLFDVSIIAQQSGYLDTACHVLIKYLDNMPGDARTQVGFITYDSYVHFYSMAEDYNQPHEMTLLDIEDPFLPRPDGLLVNLKECKELVKDLLGQLPKRFEHTHDPGSALGAALQVAYKLMQPSGGRITVFQTCLPNRGSGALEARENPNNRSAKDVAHLNPATDFYKRYALECSGYQIAVDLFLMNQQYSDMATISGVSKHSGGCVHHFPLYQKTKPQHVDSFKQCLKRYLTRKIGFEAVMRIRCTRGLQVHTFHGNFFVRSTDLLSLPNVNPDAGYGMQISYEESLSDVKTICFQAALLYTNSEGERRIRVHTLCLPVTASLPEVMHSADTEAIIGILSKMAVDRSISSNISDAREAFINATVDIFNAFKIAQNLPSGQSGQLIAPRSLALLPLYILALLKHPAFRVGTSTRLDDRVYAMDCMKTLPLDQLMKFIYPEFYKLDLLLHHAQNSNHQQSSSKEDEEEEELSELQRLQLSAEHLDSRSIYLLDCGTLIIIYIGLNVPTHMLENTLGVKTTAELPDYSYGLPHISSPERDVLRRFIMRLNEDKPYTPLIQIIRDTSTAKSEFIEKLVDDRSESSLSYYEFLQHIRSQVK